MISGHGSDSADIMLVLDYGSIEDKINEKALSGKGESLFAQFFRENGFDLRQTYRTCYLKDALTYNGKNKRLKNAAVQEARGKADYDAILKNEILTFKPNVIVPLGDLSLNFISGYSSLSNYRGSILPLSPLLQTHCTKPLRVIPTFSPERIWADIVSKVYVSLDVGKIIRNKDIYGPIEDEGSVWVCRSAEALRNFLARQIVPEFITFDIETYLGIPTCISFCFDGKEAISIPFFDDKIDKANQVLLWKEIIRLLASPKLLKVNQNIKYDAQILERFRFRVASIVGDTMLGFHLLYPELPKNLGFQNSIYTNLPYYKDESNKKEAQWNPKSYTKDTLYLYNAKDALATWQIHEKQLKDLEELGLLKLYKDRIMPLFFVYKKMEERGILVSSAKKKELHFKYQTWHDVNYEFLKQKIGYEINVGSNPQVGKLIYGELKWPMRYETTEAGQRSFKTDKDTLDDLILLHAGGQTDENKSILKLIIAIRKFKKIIEYINTPLHPGDIWRQATNLAGTNTGRTSGGKTIDTRYEIDGNKLKKVRLGRSLQTIGKHGFEVDGEVYDSIEDIKFGKDLRSMFVPRRGNIFLECDLSQADARSVAVLAEDYDLLKQFDVKPGVHCLTASWIYNKRPEEIKKGTDEYNIGKRARHAGNYMMGDFRFQQMTHLPQKECTRILETFHANAPKIRNVFHFEVIEYVRRHQTLTTPFWRRRDFFGRFDTHMMKEALAYIPQSTTGDAIKFFMPEIEAAAPWLQFLVEMHDGLLCEIPAEKLEESAHIMKREIERPIDFRRCSISRDFELTIPVEIAAGCDWQNLQEYVI